MIEIKDLLNKFDNLLLSEKIKKDTIGDVLLKTVGISIKPEDIKIQNTSIYLKIKPIYKNEIFLNKENISKELEKSLSGKIPKDIR